MSFFSRVRFSFNNYNVIILFGSLQHEQSKNTFKNELKVSAEAENNIQFQMQTYRDTNKNKSLAHIRVFCGLWLNGHFNTYHKTATRGIRGRLAAVVHTLKRIARAIRARP